MPDYIDLAQFIGECTSKFQLQKTVQANQGFIDRLSERDKQKLRKAYAKKRDWLNGCPNRKTDNSFQQGTNQKEEAP